MLRRRLLVTWTMAMICSGCADSADTRNGVFERWCGDTPCDWQVEGEVRRVGTWHPNDYGVELVSADAALIQENATIDYRDSDCLSFAMVAKIPQDVKVFLELDFLADGSVELSQRLPVSDWERRTFKVTTPTWYSKLRYIIRKEGEGRATLAEISAEYANRQCTAPAVELLGRPQGAVCATANECADGLPCEAGHCGGCASDASCDAGEVCALRDTDDMRLEQCVGRAEMPLGAACDRHEQCQTGVCADGACSECTFDRDCETGRSCLAALLRPTNTRFWPRLCGVGVGVRASGETCTASQDCRSGECRDFSVSCELNLNLSCHASDPTCFTCAPELQLGVCR